MPSSCPTATSSSPRTPPTASPNATSDGSVKREFRVPGNPIACQRLPNGNTFIATYNELKEVDTQGKTVYTHSRGPAFYLFSAQKTRNGRIVCMTAQGTILDIDPRTGKEVRIDQPRRQRRLVQRRGAA